MLLPIWQISAGAVPWPILEKVIIGLDVALKEWRNLLLGPDGIIRADGDARATIDAGGWIDIKVRPLIDGKAWHDTVYRAGTHAAAAAHT
jgi:hypothetical protein